ncbi:hypothetical protein BgAZ_301190 [Babesia gibsoni]|uniref:Secreted protein n=1 Tax=Babesia gibsoni TaxID=33632 RepID=A0AAD8LPN3_BABGI|nr:hypothetical protein BgAZ_301190 [Babesia gibsoni]
MQSPALLFAAFFAAIGMVSAKGGKGKVGETVRVLPMDCTLLKCLSSQQTKALRNYTLKQPDENDPSAHSAHRAVVKWQHNKGKIADEPVVKFWRRGDMDHVQLASLNDISLIITVLEQNDKRVQYREKKITVTIEHMKIGENGLITEKKVFGSHTIDHEKLAKAGNRFRLRYKDIFKKNRDLNPREFFVRVTSTENLIHWFLVELEEPNNYGDMVAPAT